MYEIFFSSVKCDDYSEHRGYRIDRWSFNLALFPREKYLTIYGQTIVKNVMDKVKTIAYRKTRKLLIVVDYSSTRKENNQLCLIFLLLKAYCLCFPICHGANVNDRSGVACYHAILCYSFPFASRLCKCLCNMSRIDQEAARSNGTATRLCYRSNRSDGNKTLDSESILSSYSQISYFFYCLNLTAYGCLCVVVLLRKWWFWWRLIIRYYVTVFYLVCRHVCLWHV